MSVRKRSYRFARFTRGFFEDVLVHDGIHFLVPFSTLGGADRVMSRPDLCRAGKRLTFFGSSRSAPPVSETTDDIPTTSVTNQVFVVLPFLFFAVFLYFYNRASNKHISFSVSLSISLFLRPQRRNVQSPLHRNNSIGVVLLPPTRPNTIPHQQLSQLVSCSN